jgi:serine phosphatase RsbU (regulator of sigma subunit)
VFAFMSAIPYFSEGSADSIMDGLLTIIIPLTFLTIGFIAVLGKDIKDDETDYVPDYIIRSRERERFQRELEIARNVQLKFLPQSQPEVDWLDVASNCTPAYEVGGDYYDFLQLDDHRFGVVVGDVSGKGVSAAFYMTLMKGILKSQTRHVQSPKEVLKQINDLFYENAQRGVFISMIYGVFDSEKHIFTFSRAGHNPLITHYRQKDQVEELSPYGIAIGLDKGPIFNQSLQEAEIKISSGDVFVFYTDGYSEAMNDDHLEFGEDRLIEVVRKNSNSTAETILHKIGEAVSTFTGDTSQHDDMTIVIIRVAETK